MFNHLSLPHPTVTGVAISQSSSIIRYIAAETELDGDNIYERAKIDMIFETINELFGTHPTIKFNASELENNTRLLEFINSGQRKLHFRETTNRGEYSGIMKSIVVLKTFDEMLGQNERHKQYLVGHKVSYADLALFFKLEQVHETSLHDLFMILTNLGFRRLLEHYLHLSGIMRLSQYLSSDRRMPLFERRGGDYHYVFAEVPEDDPEDMETDDGSDVHKRLYAPRAEL